MEQEDHHVAIAFSNVKGEDAPVVVSAVMTDGDGLLEIERLRPRRKADLANRARSIDKLQASFEEAECFLYDYTTELHTGPLWNAESLSETYLHIVETILDKPLLKYAVKIASLRYRKTISIPGFVESRLSSTYEAKFAGFCKSLRPFGRREYDPLLEVAKTLARIRFEENKLRNPKVSVDLVLKNPRRYLQILRLAYARPFADDFEDYFVGPPILSMRDYRGTLFHRELKVGGFRDFRPLSRFCSGIRIDEASKPCLARTAEMPFGAPTSTSGNSERCPTCRKENEYADCLSRQPSCDGIRVACGNEEFAGRVCCDRFGLYVTRSHDIVKVGNAFLPNLISRLLEQGAGGAVIFYPIEGIERAYFLEIAMRDFLRAEWLQEGRKLGIKDVRRKSPPPEVRLGDFCTSWDRDDHEVLESLRNTAIGLGNKSPVGRTEARTISLLSSYRKPESLLPKTDYLPNIPTGRRVRGRISGHRGSILFLESGGAVNVKGLHGMLAEWYG